MPRVPQNRRRPGAHHRAPAEKGRALAAFTGMPADDWRFGMDRETRSKVARGAKFCFGMSCLPLSWITFETLFLTVTRTAGSKGFWMTPEFAFYGLGAVIWLAVFFNVRVRAFTYLYVLGHEYTHALAAMLCRGRVAKVHVSADGGYILTNRSNFFIALSPYIVPFYSVVLLAGWLIAAKRWPTELAAREHVLYTLVGLTHTFHLSYTIWMITRPEQPDLDHSGRLFSIPFILWTNLLIISALLVLGSPGASLGGFIRLWVNNATTFLPRLAESVQEIWAFAAGLF